MPLGYQARALLKGLAKLGGPSSLAGVPCGLVALERNVDVERTLEPYAGFGSVRENIASVRRVVVSIDRTYAPRTGQVLVHPDGTFVLDRLLEDNGVVAQFIVSPSAAPVASTAARLGIDGGVILLESDYLVIA